MLGRQSEIVIRSHLQKAHQAAEECSFAGSVGSNQAKGFTRSNLESQIAQCLNLAASICLRHRIDKDALMLQAGHGRFGKKLMAGIYDLI